MRKLLLCLSFALMCAGLRAQHVKVLSVGNSFSLDAFAYVPFLMEELAPEVELDLGVMYIGGCSLERHHGNIQNGTQDYTFWHYHSGDGRWSSDPEKPLQYGLDKMDWDIIVFQQQSSRSRYFDTYQPFLDELLVYTKDRVPSAHFAWLMTQPYGQGYKDLGDMSMEEMWARVNTCSERVLNETSVEMVIPGGTGIQNARYTVLDRLGKAGHLVADGYHLQEGIPALIEGLTATYTFLKFYGKEVDVEKSQLVVTPEWRKERNTPQPNGEPEEASEEEYRLARQCAKWAIESPWMLKTVE